MFVRQNGDRDDDRDSDGFGHAARLAIRAGASSRGRAEKAGDTIKVSAVGPPADLEGRRDGTGVPDRAEVIGSDGDVLNVPAGRCRVVRAVQRVTEHSEADLNRLTGIL